MIDYNWILKFNEGFPDTRKRELNFFEIAGFHDWELVNSNMLRYYFDKTQDHNFGLLFTQSLAELIIENPSIKNAKLDLDFRENIKNEYIVEREYKNIDIVLLSKAKNNDKHEWAILIENKIHHWLHNPLDEYWDKVHAEKKVGIVLSLGSVTYADQFIKVNNLGKTFINLHHIELIDRINKNRSAYASPVEHRQLVLLDEYIANIELKYSNMKINPELETKLFEYQDHYAEIIKFRTFDNDMKAYIIRQLINAFEDFYFFPDNWNHLENIDKVEYFYPKNEFLEKVAKQIGIGIAISIDDLLGKNMLSGNIHLFGEYKHYYNSIKEALIVKKIVNESFKFDGSEHEDLTVIYSFSYNLGKEQKPLKQKIAQVFEINFFNEINGVVYNSFKILSEKIRIES